MKRATEFNANRTLKPTKSLNIAANNKWKVVTGLALLTLAGLLVHGYHPFAEDAEIYLPGVQKILHPELFPVGAEFFQSHARLTLFPNLIAFSVRLTHLPFAVVLLLWQLAAIFLLLLACWQLSGRFFDSGRARWAAMALVAALLTLPVAGTALYLLDQYLNPRNLAAFSGVFAVVRALQRRYVGAGLWLAFAAAMHPFMTFFAASYCALLVLIETWKLRWPRLARRVSLALPIEGRPDPYHEASMYHSFQYLSHWAWYEWLGAIAPLGIFWGFSRLAREKNGGELERVCRAFILYNVIYFAGALVLSLPQNSERLARFQPLRSLHLLYIVMIVIGGGFLGEYVLKNRPWRWVALFLPLGTGMFLAQRALFPASAHVEWPWAASKNEWVQAFVWARDHTPVDGVFAMDPWTMQIPNEDSNGFRCIAQRSMLADAVKDSGAVTMFPALGEKWWQQVEAQRGWKNLHPADLERLRREFGVSWLVLEQPGVAGLDCPYENHTVRVCRLD